MASLPNENDLRLSIERLMAHNNQSRSYPQSPLQYTQNDTSVGPCPYYPELPHSHSFNTITSIRPEYVLSEDFFAGYRNNGAMSNVRRFFCLFITFDLCFTTLLWLICIILNGKNIQNAIHEEILRYNIYTSLFDLVMAASCRFTVLLLFYGLLYINHWIVIAISTSGTCAFLIAKVFIFDWQQSAQPIFPVLLIITSFIVAWSETWFLDFKVIPQEWLAKSIFSQQEERAPLVRSYVEGLQATAPPTESNFYSPLDSGGSSVVDTENYLDDQRLSTGVVRDVHSVNELSKQVSGTESHTSTFQMLAYAFCEAEKSKIIRQAKQNLIDAWAKAKHGDWSLLKKNKTGDVIYAIKVPKLGKMYKIKGVVNADASAVFHDLIENVDDLATWNESLQISRRIQKINENTDITYQIAKDTLVTPRDFVNLRHWNKMNDAFVCSAISTTHPNLPPRPEYVRGENLLGCWIVTPIKTGGAQRCDIEWVLHSPVKLWVPQNFIDNAFANIMFDFMKYLRLHVGEQT